MTTMTDSPCPLTTAGSEPSFCHLCDQPVLPGDDIAFLDGQIVHHACAVDRIFAREDPRA